LKEHKSVNQINNFILLNDLTNYFSRRIIFTESEVFLFMKQLNGLNEKILNETLDKIENIKAVLIGDICLDVYWVADMTKSVLSRETPHFPLPVVEERMSLGAGGNAANNMATLCKNVSVVSVIGSDWRGVCLKNCLKNSGINDEYIVTVKDRITNAYCKPMRKGFLGFEVEDPRLDFESYSSIDEETEDKIIKNLYSATKGADVLCVSDQFENGCITKKVRQAINEIAKNMLVVVDSRSRISEYKNAFLKPNEIECARTLNLNDDHLTKADEIETERTLKELYNQTNSNICLTLGKKGVRVLKDDKNYSCIGLKVDDPIDTCGAGDCFLSAFSLSLAVKSEIIHASTIGNLASAISIKKINTTGSASRQEILNLFNKEAKDE